MTIKRILFVAWCVLVVACIVLLSALYSVYSTSKQSNYAYESRHVAQILALELRESSRNLTDAVRQYAVTGDQRFEDVYWDVVKIRSGEKPRPSDRKIAPGRSIPLATLMEEAEFTKEEMDYLRRANDLSNALIALETQAMMAVKGRFKDSDGQYSVMGEPNLPMAANLVFSSNYQEEVLRIMEPIAQFQKSLDSRMENMVLDAGKSHRNSFAILAIAVVLIVALIIGLLLMVYSVIVRPILLCDQFAKLVAGGKLESSLGYFSSNEIGSLANSLRAMVTALQERIKLAESANKKVEEGLLQAQKTSEEANAAQKLAEDGRTTILRTAEQVDELVGRLSAATEELSAQVEESSRSATHQDQLVHEAATAMEEMNSTVFSVAKNASDVAHGSEKARHTAVEGADVVKRSVESIKMVQDATSVLHTEMEALDKQAESIGAIMTVISDIADQTNLLALNAAIEAARAGEAGRGFAVVADEVRKLAEKTMTATQEVSQAINGIQKGTQKSMDAVSKTITYLTDTAGLVHQSGESLHLIVDEAVRVADQVQGIATAAEEQSATSVEISRTLSKISDSAKETSTAMLQSAQAVSDLAQQTSALQRLMADLRG